MHSVSSGLWGYVRDDTHLVGQDTGAITHLATMLLRCTLSALSNFLWACWTGGTEGYSPDGVCARHVAYSVK